MILDVAGLTKQFGGLKAVDGLDFQVNDSEILGLIGPNGAGKSTVLNMISGFISATSGRVVFKDRDITHLGAHKIARLGVGRNFQASLLFMELSALDNVFMAYHMGYRGRLGTSVLRLRSAVREEAVLRERGEQLLERMGLGVSKDERAENLPHGHQRILGMCIALATNPVLLLLDEPMTGMNESEKQTMMRLVREMRDSGITIVMIEHNMEAVMGLCDRVVVLNYGQKIAEGTPQEIRSDSKVIEAYLGGDEE